MTETEKLKGTTFKLDRNAKNHLEQICKLNKTIPSDVLRTMVTHFLSNYNFQQTILREVSENEH